MDTKETQSWLEVSVVVDYEAAEAVAEVLSRYAPQGVAIDLGNEAEVVTVKAYLIADETLEERQRKVEESLWHLGQIWPVPEPTFRSVLEEDWVGAWKDSIPVLKLGERIVVKPSWRNYDPAPDDVVLEMDPGLAFGTGLHPTTQLCVEALEGSVRPGMRVLDLGTGTGVLALIAAKLGAVEIVAVDNDVNAVVVARRNARHNDVAHAIRFVHGSLDDVSGAYELVVVNILAPVIIKMVAEGLVARVQTGGKLVTSGILEEQADEVREALQAAGLHIVSRRQKGDWVSLISKKAAGLPPSLTSAKLA